MRPQHQNGLRTWGKIRAFCPQRLKHGTVARGMRGLLRCLVRGFLRVGKMAKQIGDVVCGRL
jgi:hypothetical protein